MSKSVGNTLTCWAAKMVPASAATIAPNANAISFTRLTGIVIDAAASGSSRTARQARPVREVLEQPQHRHRHHQHDHQQVVVARVGGELYPKRLDRVDPDDPVRAAQHAGGATLLVNSTNASPKNSVTIAR